MANADGSIIFDVDIDEKEAQKELNGLSKKISSTKQKLSSLREERLPLAEQAKQLGAALDRAKEKLAQMQSVSGTPAESIKYQEETVKSLQSRWDEVQSRVERYDNKIKTAEKTLAQSETRAGELAQKIANAGKSSEKMAQATKKARKQMDAFGKRIAAVVRSALIFTVITQALAKFRDWLGRVVKTSDEATAAMAKLKGALLTMVQPLVEVIIPAFTLLVNVATKCVMALARLFSWLSGSSVKANAAAAESLYNEAEALEGVGGAAKDAQKQLAGFDEINKLSDPSQGGGGADTIMPDFDFGEVDGFGDKLREIFSIFEPFVTRAKELLAELVAFDFSPLGEGLSMMLTGLLEGDFPMFAEGATLIINTLDAFIRHAAVALLEFIRDIGFMFLEWVSSLGNSFLDWLDEITGGRLSNTIAAIRLLFNNLIEDVKLIFDGLIMFLIGVFTGDWEMAWEGIKKIFSGIFNGIADIAIGTVNTIISFIRDLISWIERAIAKLRELLSAKSNVGGSGGIGGYGSFATVTASAVPHLAKGAVIPANREFLAVLGDQKQGTNIEAPLSTIEQALENVMRRRGGAGGSITVIMELDKREFGRAVYEYGGEESQRVGVSLEGAPVGG